MFTTLPKDYLQFSNWTWEQFQPFAEDLVSRQITTANVSAWLTDWSDLSCVLSEIYQRSWVATTVNTADKKAKHRFIVFLDGIHQQSKIVDQQCKEKLLASGLVPQGMQIPIKHMSAEAEIYRESNLPLLSIEQKLNTEYDEIIGEQTVTFEGKEHTVTQLRPYYQRQDRPLREQVWRLGMQRQLADREKINNLWVRMLENRGQIAVNAELPNYRDYIWKTYHRFDYTPQDCTNFHAAIEQEVVPVVRQIHEKRRLRMGVEYLRPWDITVDPLGREALKPYQSVRELEEKASTIFHCVDPQLGGYFDLMRRKDLLDLENRKGKAPGAYCTSFDAVKLPFIFENAVGIHDDVQTILHESGHAFHVFETAHLPYRHQLDVGMEMAEVASMAMELLAGPYLPASQGGFYSHKDAARARIEHLESLLLFWPYMAVVDAFQHWVYDNYSAAIEPANCDTKWSELWQRFMVGVDYSGLDDNVMTGWQRKMHIFQVPFYYVEYGLAQLGAMQIWRNARNDQAGAVAAYRRALALGCTVPLPELYETAEVKFAFDADTLGAMVRLSEDVIQELELIE